MTVVGGRVIDRRVQIERAVHHHEVILDIPDRHHALALLAWLQTHGLHQITERTVVLEAGLPHCDAVREAPRFTVETLAKDIGERDLLQGDSRLDVMKGHGHPGK